MMRVAILLLFGFSASTPAVESKGYGRPLQGCRRRASRPCSRTAQNGQPVRLEGRIEKVCQKKGCWLELKEGERSVMVSFEGYSFFVPKGSAGREVVLEGRVKLKARTAEEVKHLKAEGAGSGGRSRGDRGERGRDPRSRPLTEGGPGLRAASGPPRNRPGFRRASRRPSGRRGRRPTGPRPPVQAT